MGVRATDRRLCPASDWGLGLVTGIQFYRLAAPRSHTHMPSLARWEAGMESPIGCLEVSVGCLQWQRTHKDLHTQKLILHGVPWAVKFLHHWQALPWPLCPRVLVIFFFLTSSRRAKCRVCVIRIQLELDWFLQGMLIRRMLPTHQSVAARDRNRLWRCHRPLSSDLFPPAESTLPPQMPYDSPQPADSKNCQKLRINQHICACF